MKILAYSCLSGFFLAFITSLVTFAESNWIPQLGDLVITILFALCFFGVIALILVKSVGFGSIAIPSDRRGLIASLRAVPILIWVTLTVSLLYTTTIVSVTKTGTVRNLAGTYSLVTEDETGIKGTRRRLEDHEVRSFRARDARLLTAFSMNIFAISALFFSSRAARQSPELEQLHNLSLQSGQVDDSMTLPSSE